MNLVFICNFDYGFVDRPELRFRLLFEYYQDFHSEKHKHGEEAQSRISKMDISDVEKNAALNWLIDSNFVEGSIHHYGGNNIAYPFISRINNHGINYVESVMDLSFTQIKDKFPDINKLDKTERIKKFATECLRHPATSEICKATYDAIINFMTG